MTDDQQPYNYTPQPEYQQVAQQQPPQPPQPPQSPPVETHHMSPLPYNAGTISVAVFSILTFILTLFILKSVNQAIKNTAVDNCFRVSTSIKQGEHIRPIYDNCLNDKGYQPAAK